MALMELPQAPLSPWPARPVTVEADLSAAPLALSTVRTLASGSNYALRNIGTVDLAIREIATMPDPADGGRTVAPDLVEFAKAEGIELWAWGEGARLEISLAPWWLACFRLRGAVMGRARYFSASLGVSAYRVTFLDSLGKVASARVERDAPRAPQATRDEATIRFAGYLMHSGFGTLSQDKVGPLEIEHVTNHANAWRNCGAGGLLAPWKIRRAGVIG